MSPHVRAGLGIALMVLAAFVAGFYYFERVLDIKYWIVDKTLDYYYWLVRAIDVARKPIHEVGRDDDSRVILVPRSAGPVIESPDSKYPQPLTRIPIRSTKALAKKHAHQYAERRAGRPLSWKRARQLLNQWGREEKAPNAQLVDAIAAAKDAGE
jgi:hypothetical protein